MHNGGAQGLNQFNALHCHFTPKWRSSLQREISSFLLHPLFLVLLFLLSRNSRYIHRSRKMVSDGQFWARLFYIPELAEIIYPLLDPKSLHTLRLASKFFCRECAPYFPLTFDLDNNLHFPCLEKMILSAFAPKTEPRSPNTLQQIRTIKLTSGHFLYLQLVHVFPRGMASVLNRSGSSPPTDNKGLVVSNRPSPRATLLTDPDKQALSILANMRLYHLGLG